MTGSTTARDAIYWLKQLKSMSMQKLVARRKKQFWQQLGMKGKIVSLQCCKYKCRLSCALLHTACASTVKPHYVNTHGTSQSVPLSEVSHLGKLTITCDIGNIKLKFSLGFHFQIILIQNTSNSVINCCKLY